MISARQGVDINIEFSYWNQSYISLKTLDFGDIFLNVFFHMEVIYCKN